MTAPRDIPMGLVLDMPAEEYHSIDALSATGLKHFARSPWHYRHRVNIEPTRPMFRGTLAHCAVLEPDAMAARYIVVPEDAPRRPTAAQWNAKKPSDDSAKAMQWWRDFLEAAKGREIVTADEYAITQAQLRAVAAAPDLASILRHGVGEASVFWIDEETGVYCKARPDWMNDAHSALWLLDLKSTADESPSGFGRAAARMKYHIQQAHYVAGVKAATGRPVDKFVFGAVTSAAPVLAVPYELTDEIREQAHDEWRELIERFAWCKANDTWPAYGAGIQLLDFPAYAKRDNEVEVSFAD